MVVFIYKGSLFKFKRIMNKPNKKRLFPNDLGIFRNEVLNEPKNY